MDGIFAAVLAAVAERLDRLWPERPVRVDEVAAGAAGSFFVRVTGIVHGAELDRRRKSGCTVDIAYYDDKHRTVPYLVWAEEMCRAFGQVVLADGTVLYARNMHAEPVGREYHFVFDLRARGMLLEGEGSCGDVMERMEMAGV